MAREVSRAQAKPVEVIVQQRLGTTEREGGAMNTALALAARQGRDRVHFFDADITNFDASWIDGAEAAADRGFGVVRHRFPQGATDAMITWMITGPPWPVSSRGLSSPDSTSRSAVRSCSPDEPSRRWPGPIWCETAPTGVSTRC